jgi:signal transduction histidine kinase
MLWESEQFKAGAETAGMPAYRGSGRTPRGLRTLTARLLTAQEQERRNLSRDLHEDLNQKLALLAVEFDSVSQALAVESQEVLRGRIGDLRARVNEVSDRLRRIAYELHPTVLEHLGLEVGVRALCEDYAAKGMHLRLRHTSLPEAIPMEVSLCIYRVIQEVLARGYARGGAGVSIVLAGTRSGVTVSLTEAPGEGGTARDEQADLGTLRIAERVRLVEGSLSTRSRPKGGSRLIVRIPLEREAIS